MQCPICAANTELFGSATVLRRHRAQFCRCLSCGFLFAQDPSWLPEAYASALTATDVGLVERNLWFAGCAASVVTTFFAADGRFLDYGGGTGLFTRLMRDRGYDWYWHDPVCQNLFAQGFAVDPAAGGGYEVLSACELFEHLADPVATLDRLSQLSPNILFTTQLLPDPTPRLDQWWYYGLEHGQHISFYTRKSLQLLGGRFGLSYCGNGRNLHLFSKKPVSALVFRLAVTAPFASLVPRLRPRRSLQSADVQRAHTLAGEPDAHRD